MNSTVLPHGSASLGVWLKPDWSEIGAARLGFWSWRTLKEVDLALEPLCAPREIDSARQISHPGRRTARLASRAVAKLLWQEFYQPDGSPGCSVQIACQERAGQADRPALIVGDMAHSAGLSVAHSDQAVLVAMTPAGVSPGVDLVAPNSVTKAVAARWFTASERAVCEQTPAAAAQIWAAKEAAYKALQRGESFYPLRFEVACLSNNAGQCRYSVEGEEVTVEVKYWSADSQHLAAYTQAPSDWLK